MMMTLLLSFSIYVLYMQLLDLKKNQIMPCDMPTHVNLNTLGIYIEVLTILILL